MFVSLSFNYPVFFKAIALPVLKVQQKKILVIASLIFGLLLTCYIFIRLYRFRAAFPANNQNKLIEKKYPEIMEVNLKGNLGVIHSNDAIIEPFNERPMTKSELYLKAIDLNPGDAQAYCNLGITLSLNESIKLLDGTQMTQQELYLKAIDLNPGYAQAYYNLAATIPFNGSIQLPDGTQMTQQELFLKTINLDPNFVQAYRNFGNSWYKRMKNHLK